MLALHGNPNQIKMSSSFDRLFKNKRFESIAVTESSSFAVPRKIYILYDRNVYKQKGVKKGMCDINKLSEKNERLKKKSSDVLCTSGAVVLRAEKQVRDIEIKSEDNMRKLSILL